MRTGEVPDQAESLIDEVRCARMDAFHTRRIFLSGRDPEAIEILIALADADRRAEALGKYAGAPRHEGFSQASLKGFGCKWWKRAYLHKTADRLSDIGSRE